MLPGRCLAARAGAAALLLCLLFLSPASAAYLATDPDWNKDDVKKQIYSSIEDSPNYYCFKLLTVDGEHGCDSQQTRHLAIPIARTVC